MPRPEPFSTTIPAPLSFEPGDLLFFYGRTWQSRVIEAVTAGPSHVGIISAWGNHLDDGRVLFESTTLCELPDILTGKQIQGVQAHDPIERIRAYDGRVRRMRLRRPLCENEQRVLARQLYEAHGRPYDLEGALESGTRLYKWTPFMPYPDLGHLFCSELVADVLQPINRMPVSNPGLYNPASLMRALRRWAVYLAPEEITVPSLN